MPVEELNQALPFSQHTARSTVQIPCLCMRTKALNNAFGWSLMGSLTLGFACSSPERNAFLIASICRPSVSHVLTMALLTLPKTGFAGATLYLRGSRGLVPTTILVVTLVEATDRVNAEAPWKLQTKRSTVPKNETERDRAMEVSGVLMTRIGNGFEENSSFFNNFRVFFGLFITNPMQAMALPSPS